MNREQEGWIAIVAALVVLLSAMRDPRVSIAVATVALVLLGIWTLRRA